ncbi:MAG: prolyl oligopeptidase family serine peptidase [Bacteroidetes bacterium]|nr:prolyl oligopeptidase family serine peptidase [Bacteroidota bacterium]
MIKEQKIEVRPALHYLVREPLNAIEKPPVLILLHGVGSNERDLFSVAGKLPEDFLVLSLRGPYRIGPQRYAWYQVDFKSGKPAITHDQEAASRELLMNFIEEMGERHQFDPQRIFIGGFSQGAIMSLSLGLIHPELFKGIVAISGRLPEELRAEFAPSNELSGLKVFVAHGTHDRVLTIDYARKLRSFLNGFGVSSFYKEYNAGHGISGEMLQDLNEWLNKAIAL